MRAPKGETVARAVVRCRWIDDAYRRGYATVADIRESERLLAVAIRRAVEGEGDLRASSRESAKDQVRARVPGAYFYR